MHHFAYRDGVLHAEAVNLAKLAEKVGTPFYCYSTATLERHYRVFADAFADVPSLVCYAVKANSNQAVIATLARMGAGADVVSGGELKRALLAGVPANKIMFSGIGKTASELALALEENIFCVNVESEPELELLSSIATSKGQTASISIRVNPDVDAKTHAKIATGKSENKFGIPISHAREVYARAGKLPGIRVVGVDMHIGSQITDLTPFDNAFALLSDFVRTLRKDGHTISHVDLGGGLGIPYHDSNELPPDPTAYAEVVKRATRGIECKLIFEPGRLIVGGNLFLSAEEVGVILREPADARHSHVQTFGEGVWHFHRQRALLERDSGLNALVVNLGDAMARWTNDRWRSTMHRVLVPVGRRQSIAFFHNANWDAVIECLPPCRGADGSSTHPPIAAGPHLMQKFRATVTDR